MRGVHYLFYQKRNKFTRKVFQLGIEEQTSTIEIEAEPLSLTQTSPSNIEIHKRLKSILQRSPPVFAATILSKFWVM